MSAPTTASSHPALSPPRAVLWDMDGTLVDTEPYWIDAEHDLIGSYGGTWTHEQGLQLVGNDLLVSGQIIKEQTDIPLLPREIMDALLDRVIAMVESEVPWRPGARELLAALAERGTPCALVTMSWRRFVDPVVAALPAGSFAVTVAGDEVEHGKPAPEAYLRAASLLGVPAAECVAIEDSATGTKAAVAAGCPTLVVPSHADVSAGELRFKHDTLATIDVGDLSRLWASLSGPRQLSGSAAEQPARAAEPPDSVAE